MFTVPLGIAFGLLAALFQALSYLCSKRFTVCGLVGLLMALRMKAFSVPGVQRHAAPFAASWLQGMCFLFAAFAAVGVIFGNMLQSTRGLISVGIAALILRAGIRDLEAPTGRRRLALRAVGAALMTGAIVLYYGTAAEFPARAARAPQNHAETPRTPGPPGP